MLGDQLSPNSALPVRSGMKCDQHQVAERGSHCQAGRLPDQEPAGATGDGAVAEPREQQVAQPAQQHGHRREDGGGDPHRGGCAESRGRGDQQVGHLHRAGLGEELTGDRVPEVTRPAEPGKRPPADPQVEPQHTDDQCRYGGRTPHHTNGAATSVPRAASTQTATTAPAVQMPSTSRAAPGTPLAKPTYRVASTQEQERENDGQGDERRRRRTRQERSDGHQRAEHQPHGEDRPEELAGLRLRPFPTTVQDREGIGAQPSADADRQRVEQQGDRETAQLLPAGGPGDADVRTRLPRLDSAWSPTARAQGRCLAQLTVPAGTTG